MGVLPLHTKSLDARAPADVVARLNQYEEGGRILNEYKWGGYLIYALPRDFQVFIDGRTEILYSPDFYSDYRALGRPDEALLTKLKTDWAPDFAIWSFDQAPHSTLVNGLGMQVDFIGKEHLLYKTTDSATEKPLTRFATLLKFPMCVTERDIALLPDMLAADQNHPNRSYLLDMLSLLEQYDQAGTAQTPSGRSKGGKSTDRVLRLAAHSLLAMGQPSAAADTWAQISLIATRDLIYGAYALIKAQRYEQAEELITLATSTPWQSFHPLTMAQVTRLETLRIMLNDAGYTPDESAVGDVAPINPDSTSSHSAIISPDNIIYTAHCADLAFKNRGRNIDGRV
jgi:tetratricopeptide (TPR) repeat protein